MCTRKGQQFLLLLTVLLSGIFFGWLLRIDSPSLYNQLTSTGSSSKFSPLPSPPTRTSPPFFSSPMPRVTEVSNHSPIRINGNEDFRTQAATEGWDLQGTRDGTSTKPFMLTGYAIRNNTIKLVSINNTSLHFVFSNNILTNVSDDDGPWEGLECINVTNGVIENNYIQSTIYYIPPPQSLQDRKVDILDPSMSKDPILQTEHFFTSPSSMLQKMPYFYAGLRCDNSQLIIRGNTISGFMALIHVEDSSNLQISNNSLRHSLFSISLSNNSHNNLCINNTLSYSHQPVMIGGPSPFASRNNTFCTNFFNNCFAAFTIGSGQKNKILNNTVLNGHVGIFLSQTQYILFSGNTISAVELAVAFVSASKPIQYPGWNNFSRNLIFNCERGFELQNTQNNIITANQIFNQESYGILVMYDPGYPPAPPSAARESSCYNNISKNVFYNNSGGDVRLENDTSHNIVMLNKFLPTTTNSSRILDNGFCNYVVYNYYADWIVPDWNLDGIVDVPYLIAGTAENLDPFPLVSMNTTLDVNAIPDLFTCRNVTCISTRTSPLFSSLWPLGLIIGVGLAFGLTYAVVRKKTH